MNGMERHVDTSDAWSLSIPETKTFVLELQNPAFTYRVKLYLCKSTP